MKETIVDELLKSLGIICAPENQDKKFIQITCGVGFEPHGRASETWELWWKLTLPQVPHHWRSTTRWRVGTTEKPIQFTGETFDQVVSQAIEFLTELRKEISA